MAHAARGTRGDVDDTGNGGVRAQAVFGSSSFLIQACRGAGLNLACALAIGRGAWKMLWHFEVNSSHTSRLLGTLIGLKV